MISGDKPYKVKIFRTDDPQNPVFNQTVDSFLRSVAGKCDFEFQTCATNMTYILTFMYKEKE